MSKKPKKILAFLIFAQLLLVGNSKSYADMIILNKDTTQGVNVRERKDYNSKILGGIEDFTAYEIKNESDDWYEIDFKGKTAYVGKTWFFKLNHTSLINESDLKEEPKDDSKNIVNYKLQANSKVNILEFDEESDYVKVSYDEDFLDNKKVNFVNINELINTDLFDDLSSENQSKEINTITLDDSNDNMDIPKVVTLDNQPETVEISDSINKATGYIKLSDLAISKKSKEDLEEFKNYYKEINDHIKAKLEEEINNQSYILETTQYFNTETFSNVQTYDIPVSGNPIGVELYNWACQFLGRPYVWGGTNLYNGIDCSGFTMRIYEQAGIGLPHFAQSQQRYGVEIPFGYEMAGDLVFFGTSLNNITHVGMADGNGNMIHASSPRVGIIISPIRNPISIKRIIQ